MNEQEIKNLMGTAGEELASLVLQRFVTKLGDDLAAVVGKAQRAQGAAEQAETEAKSRKATLDKYNTQTAAENTTLRNENAALKTQNTALKAERDDLTAQVAKLREVQQHASAALKTFSGGVQP